MATLAIEQFLVAAMAGEHPAGQILRWMVTRTDALNDEVERLTQNVDYARREGIECAGAMAVVLALDGIDDEIVQMAKERVSQSMARRQQSFSERLQEIQDALEKAQTEQARLDDLLRAYWSVVDALQRAGVPDWLAEARDATAIGSERVIENAISALNRASRAVEDAFDLLDEHRRRESTMTMNVQTEA